MSFRSKFLEQLNLKAEYRREWEREKDRALALEAERDRLRAALASIFATERIFTEDDCEEHLWAVLGSVRKAKKTLKWED